MGSYAQSNVTEMNRRIVVVSSSNRDCHTRAFVRGRAGECSVTLTLSCTIVEMPTDVAFLFDERNTSNIAN